MSSSHTPVLGGSDGQFSCSSLKHCLFWHNNRARFKPPTARSSRWTCSELQLCCSERLSGRKTTEPMSLAAITAAPSVMMIWLRGHYANDLTPERETNDGWEGRKGRNGREKGSQIRKEGAAANTTMKGKANEVFLAHRSWDIMSLHFSAVCLQRHWFVVHTFPRLPFLWFTWKVILTSNYQKAAASFLPVLADSSSSSSPLASYAVFIFKIWLYLCS